MIRDAKAKDAEEICTIWNEVIEHTTITFTTELKTVQTIQNTIKSQPFLVFEATGQIGGFATFSPFRGGPGYAHTFEHTIMLAESCQGQGVGKTLMGALKIKAQASGAHSLIAGMSGTNPRAIAFHKSQGFTQVAHIPQAGRKFDTWLDLILMQHMLPATK